MAFKSKRNKNNINFYTFLIEGKIIFDVLFILNLGSRTFSNTNDRTVFHCFKVTEEIMLT